MLKFNTTKMTPPGGWRYRQPSPAMEFSATTLSGLLRKVASARGTGQPEGWERAVEDEMCLQLGREDWCRDHDSPQPFRSALERLGRKLWKDLHAKAASLPGQLAEDQVEKLESWLSAWEEGIPSWGGCACKRHWLEVKARIPADFSSGGAFLQWTVAAHNAVNLRLGKPQWISPAP